MTKLKEYLAEIISDVAGVTAYFERANDEAEYPYVVFNFSDWTPDDFVRRTYDLNIEIWDKAPNPKQVLSVAEKLVKFFKSYKDNNDGFIIATYIGTGTDFIDDPDKDLWRLRCNFEMHLVFKED